MSHKWTREAGLREVDAILASSGHAKKATQIVRAFLHAFNMTDRKYRHEIVEKILREFDPKSPVSARTYDFPEPWSKAKWELCFSSSYDSIKSRLVEIRKTCGCSLERTAKNITACLNLLSSDDCTIFLTLVTHHAGWCPFNFKTGSIQVSDEEWARMEHESFSTDIINIVAENIRFISMKDMGSFLRDFIFSLKDPKQQVVALSMALEVMKMLGTKNSSKVTSGLIEALFSSAGPTIIGVEVTRKQHDPNCACERCTLSRGAINN